MNWIRLEAEVIRDSCYRSAGNCTRRRVVPGPCWMFRRTLPKGSSSLSGSRPTSSSSAAERSTRFNDAVVILPMMEVFDGANMSESCSRRNATVVAPQALTLLNGELTDDEARQFADRIVKAARA